MRTMTLAVGLVWVMGCGAGVDDPVTETLETAAAADRSEPAILERPFTAEQIRDRVVNGVQPGAIVLMHNWPEKTRKALPEMIAALKAKGYEFATVSELLALSPTQAGKAAN